MKHLLIILSLLLSLPTFSQDLLDAPSMEEFSERALDKAKELGLYISTIGQKEEEPSKKREAIRLALKLFLNDGEANYMQVSSKNTNSKNSYLVNEYLRRLQRLKYDRVEIKWFDVHRVTELKKGRDGNYYGTITVYQKFIGYNAEGLVAYEDVTQKNIEVVLKKTTKTVGAESVEVWGVFLGDIEVIETM